MNLVTREGVSGMWRDKYYDKCDELNLTEQQLKETQAKLDKAVEKLEWLLADGNRPNDTYYGQLYAHDIKSILKEIKE